MPTPDNDIPDIFNTQDVPQIEPPIEEIDEETKEMLAINGAMEAEIDSVKFEVALHVSQYRQYQSNKKIAEANLDGLKVDLRPLLNKLAELTDGIWSDERGFAKIVTPKTPMYRFVSDDNAGALYDLATNWAASDIPAVKQAGITTLALIETKTRAPYVLVK